MVTEQASPVTELAPHEAARFAQAQAWCNALAGPGAHILFNIIWPDKRGPAPRTRAGPGRGRKSILLHGALTMLWAELDAANKAGWGVYAVPQGGDWFRGATVPKREASRVREWRAWFADCDKPEAVTALLALPPEARPSMVVRTRPPSDDAPYGRMQALWLAASDRPNPEQAATLLVPVIIALGADHSAKDMARVLRVPGFLNTKPDVNALAELAFLDINRRFTQQTFAALWPAPPTTATPYDDGATADAVLGMLDLRARLEKEPRLVETRARMTEAALRTIPPLVFNVGRSDDDMLAAAMRMRDLGWSKPDEMADALAGWFARAADGDPKKGHNRDMGNRDFLITKCRNALRYGKDVPGSSLLMNHDGAMAAEETESDEPSAEKTPEPDVDPEAGTGVPPPPASDEAFARWAIAWKLSVDDPEAPPRHAQADGTTPTPPTVRPLPDGDLIRRWDKTTGAWLPVPEMEITRHISCREGLPAVHIVAGKRKLRPLELTDRKIRSVTVSIRRILAENENALAREGETPWTDAEPAAAFAGRLLLVRPDGTIAVRPALPADRVRAGFPFAWPADVPTDADPPSWLNPDGAPFFSECLHTWIGEDMAQAAGTSAAPGRAEATARTVAAFFGSCVLGIAPLWEKAIMVQGRANNGKGTLLTILRRLFPPQDVAAVPLHRWTDEKYVVQLAGRRVNMIADDRGAEVMDESDFKSVVSSEDIITGRDLYKSVIFFRPTCGHILMRNLLPKVKDQSDGFWRRWILLRFAGTVPKNRLMTMPRLLARIKPELPAIAAWTFRGAAWAMRAGGYGDVPGADAAVRGWREDSDQVLQWLRERCAVASNGEGMTPSEAFADYSIWASMNGHKAMGARTLTGRLQEMGHEQHRTGAARRWPLRLVKEGEEPAAWEQKTTEAVQ